MITWSWNRAVVCFFAALASGCAGGGPTSPLTNTEASPPPIVLAGISIDDFGNGAVCISALGFREYIKRYGMHGWLKGLSDGRLVSDAVRANRVKEVSSEEYRAMSDGITVGDLFCSEYLRSHGQPTQDFFKAQDAERAAIIRSVIGQIKVGKCGTR
jgi:hypothetical protein